ncbi:MAG TPA: DUF3592 domain-containing protein [Flavisolibacter sp.]|nr:DUF3592 domain-containing protein [Flavisolibacter sp.]
MSFSKNSFFFLLLLLLTLPFLLPNITWLLRSQKTTGRVEGIGAASGMSLGKDTYALVSFTVGKGTFYFHGVDDDYEAGNTVPVRYQPANPEDAKIDGFYSLWGNTIAYIGAPLIFWIIFFFAKDIVPNGSRIRFGGKPFVRVLPPVKTGR